MTEPLIRPAHSDEYDEIARLWMESWVSTGLDQASNSLLQNLRARIPREVDNGWTVVAHVDPAYVATPATPPTLTVSVVCSD